MTAYDPDACYEITVWEEDFRQTPTRLLRARICQPVGKGPFPVLLDLHGGAWTFKDRTANVAVQRARWNSAEDAADLAAQDLESRLQGKW